MKLFLQVTKLKIKYNPFAKAFKETKIKTEEVDIREQEVYQPVVGYGKNRLQIIYFNGYVYIKIIC